MNTQGSNIPLPPPPAATGSPAQAAAEAGDQTQAAGDKGEDEPVLTEGQAAKQPEGRVLGDAATTTAGREGQAKKSKSE